MSVKRPDQQQIDLNNNIYKPEWQWYGRSLENYKQMHRSTATARGVEKEFMAAKTLTQAKKLAFGIKRKNT